LNKTYRKKFIHKCPSKDCKGFVSTAYKCGICEKFTCSKCLEIKGDTQNAEHICDENNVKSAEIVDDVVIFKEDAPYELIKKVKPDILVKGADYKDKEVVGSDIAKEVKLIEFVEGKSTTSIIERMKLC